MRLTQKAHAIISAVIRAGDIAVDATAGNGHDTVFLAHTVGAGGQVCSFDLQSDALQATQRLLAEHGEELARRVTLINACHSQLARHLPADLQGQVACVMFNLGYLPGGDHSVTTRSSTTLPAIAQATRLLRPGGVISILGYTAHNGGQQEVDAVLAWMLTPEGRRAVWQEIDRNDCKPGAPRLFIGRYNG